MAMNKIDFIIDSVLMEEKNRLNENFYNENSFFEKKHKKKKSKDYLSDEDREENRKNTLKNTRLHKKSKKMASEALLKVVRDLYAAHKDTVNLRGICSKIYGIPTDTTGSNKNVINLNSKTRKVLAALNGEVRDNGQPWKLTKYEALRLRKLLERG